MPTYYVDTSSGKDSYSGGVSDPFKTISQGTEVLFPGDTLVIRGGTYTERISLDGLVATEARPVMIKSFPGETVTLTESWNPSGVSTRSWSGVGIPGFGTTYTSTNINYSWISIQNCTYINVTGINVSQIAGRGILFENCKNCTISDCTVTQAYGSGCRIGFSRDITVDRVDLDSVSLIKFVDYSLGGVPSTFLVRNSDRVTVRNSSTVWGGTEGFVAGRASRWVTFEDCYSANNRHNQFYVNTSKYTVFRRCYAYNSDAFRAEPAGSRYGFISRDENGALADARGSKNTETTWENCIAVRCSHGLLLDSKAHVNGDVVVNCTFAYNDKGIVVASPYTNNQGETRDRTGATIINNIIYGGGSKRASGNSNIKFLGNLWSTSAPGGASNNADVIGDPLFSNGGSPYNESHPASNYEITASSPAIGEAVDSSVNPSSDYNRLSRGSTSDMGAFEYNAGGGSITASFTGTPTSGNGSLTVSFTEASTSTSSITSYLWEVDSGSGYTSFSTQQNPSLTLEPGTYSIRLTVTGPDGSDTQTRSGYISVSGGTSSPDEIILDGTFDETFTNNWNKYPGALSAVASGGKLTLGDRSALTSPQFYQNGLGVSIGKTYTVSFDAWAASSSSSGLRVVARQAYSPYSKIGLDQSFSITTSQTTYSYSFDAQSTETDARLQFMLPNSSQDIYFDNVSLQLATQDSGVTAEFSLDTTSGYTPLTVSFVDESVASLSVTGWVWEYSTDEVTWTQFSTSQNPSQSFTTGTYSIRLTASTSSSSDVSTKSGVIIVSSGTADIPPSETFMLTEDDPTVVMGAITVSPSASETTMGASTPTVNVSDFIYRPDPSVTTMTATSPAITMPGSAVLKPRTRAHTLTARRKEVGSVFGVREEPLWISTVESRYYTINPTTTSDYGTPSAIVSTSLYDVTDPNTITDVTSTGVTGSSSVSNGSIITAFVDGTALTDGNEYELEIVFTNTRGETVLVTSEIIASRRG